MATGIASGLGATFGFAVEGTVGTYQTPVSFLTFLKDGMSYRKNTVQGQGLHGGPYLLASRRAVVTHGAPGSISTELYDRQFGKLWKGCLGVASTPLPIGATAAYVTVFTPDVTSAGTGYTLTMQIGKPGTNSTINPFSYTGTKITDWTLAVNNTSLATFDITTDSWTEDVTQTFTAPSYVASNVLHFAEATLLIGGTVAPFSTAVASGSNSVNTSTFSGSGTLNVTASSVVGLPSAGTITVATGSTPATITYSGTTVSTFTGCTTTAGGGVMSTGGAVTSTYSTVTSPTTAATATGISIKGMNALATERYYLGSAGVKAEQIANGFRGISGQADFEFRALADAYTAFQADTPLALQLNFVGPTIASGVTSQVQVLIPRIYWDTSPLNVDGPALLKQTLAFTGLDDGVNNQVQVTVVSLDSTV